MLLDELAKTVSGKLHFTFLAGLKILQGSVMQCNGIYQTIFSILQSFHSLLYVMGGTKLLESLLVLLVSLFRLDIISGLVWIVMITLAKLIKYILLGQLIESTIHIFLFGRDIILMVLEFFSDGSCLKKGEINSFRNFSAVEVDLSNF